MLNKLLFCLLLGSTLSSFTTLPVIEPSTRVCDTGNEIRATISEGAINLNWSFQQPAVTYWVIIVDIEINRTVRTLQTGSTSATFTGLPSGTYRATVSNGSEFVIIDDVIVH